jgi:hypothetical protein
MSESTVGILLLVIVSLVVSFAVHRKTPRYLLGCILAATVATITFQLLAYVKVGYVDPFIWISGPVSFLISLGLAAMVGAVLRSRRTRRSKRGEGSLD